MANLVLTTSCNRTCVYCFAGRTVPLMEMQLDAAIRLLDWLAASGRSEVRLLGGEPTLHTRFPLILQAALERGLNVLVFSNGLMPPDSLAAITDAPLERCRVMLNLNIGMSDSVLSAAHVSRTADALGGRAFVGVNIYRLGLPLMEAAAFANRHGLRKVIRVGLAHPRQDRKNVWLHPRDYRRVGEEIEVFLKLIQPEGYALSFDCGFVPCMFSSAFLQMAGVDAAELGRRCGPIPDILPDLTAIPCLPLGELDQLPVSDLDTVGQLNGLLQQQCDVFRGIGVFKECPRCQMRESGQCAGGCTSVALSRVRRTPVAVCDRPARTPAREPVPKAGETKAWSVPFIDQPEAFWASLVSEHGAVLQEVYFPIGLDGIGSGRPAQPERHLADVLRAGVVPMSVLVNPLVLPQSLEVLEDRITEELLRLYEYFGVCAATLADVRLALRVRDRLPFMRLTGSCLLEISEPAQARSLREAFDVLVPATRMIRHPERLSAIRSAFGKPLRLLVNEGCLNDCLERKQHFFEMGANQSDPLSLCSGRLAKKPWLRLTGAWALPQHLSLLDRVADQFKLAGRVTLKDPEHYRRVLRAYVTRTALWPHEIGGGPASCVSRVSVSRQLFERMLDCDHLCEECGICRRLAPHAQMEPVP